MHKGGPTSDPGNCRPISVNQLQGYLEKHQLLHPHQGAYRYGRSSGDILLCAIKLTQLFKNSIRACCLLCILKHSILWTM